MQQDNPYAAPQSSLTHASENCRREGKYVFIPKGSDLPERCIICNAPAKLPAKTRKMYWHNPWLYVLVIISIPIYVIVALIVRKSTKVTPCLCATHSTKRRNKILFFLIPGVISLISGIILLTSNNSSASILIVIAILLMIISLIVSGTLTPKRIDLSGAKFAGCKEAFLSSLDL